MKVEEGTEKDILRVKAKVSIHGVMGVFGGKIFFIKKKKKSTSSMDKNRIEIDWNSRIFFFRSQDRYSIFLGAVK